MIQILIAAAALALPLQEESPEAVAKAYFKTMVDLDWKKGAELMHPEELKRLQDLFVTLAQSADRQGKFQEMNRLFPDAESAEDLSKLSPQDFFTSFMTNVSSLQPGMKEAMKGCTMEILGHVAEGSDTVHVVHRMSMKVQEIEIKRVSVISLKKSDAGWRMTLTAETETMIQGMKKRFGTK